MIIVTTHFFNDWEKDTIEINVLKKVDPDSGHVTMVINDENPILRGSISSGKSLEEAKKSTLKSLKIMLDFYYHRERKLSKLAIFQKGPWNTSTFWFVIVGVGLSIYVRPKNSLYLKNKPLPKLKNSINIGNKVRISFINYWKNKN